MRIFLAACVSFFLLGLQHEALVHAFQHDAARVSAGDKALLQNSAEGSCAACTVLSGGAQAVPSVTPALAHRSWGSCVRSLGKASWISRAPVYYPSRAPPAAS
ncbi:MAG: hypothetical protein M3Z31_14100 [Pseudomonadota bacterium]|nr:hypothetical protein [Pseudomonadota bacterium]